MSSRNQSPPETPTRDGQGSEHEGEVQDRVGILQPPSTAIKQHKHHSVVEVPCSQPHESSSSQEVRRTDSQFPQEVENNNEAKGDDVELPAYDWQDLETRYTKALIETNQIENEICEKFDAYADAFEAWSLTSAQKDNARAQKRFKTKMSFVQLSERELEHKKQHYITVVAAFRSALNLIKAPSAMPMR